MSASKFACAIALVAFASATNAAGPECRQGQALRNIMGTLERCGNDELCRRDGRIYAVPSASDQSHRARARPCTDETALLTADERYAVVRDRKMCQDGKFHTLVMPRADLRGVERIDAAAGIWKYAWEQALQSVPAGRDVFLVVNSRYSRGQDWLHVHIMEGDMAVLDARRGGRDATFEVRVAEIESIDRVGETAATLSRNALASGEFSILVAARRTAGTGGERFSVLVARIAACNLNNTEKYYTR